MLEYVFVQSNLVDCICRVVSGSSNIFTMGSVSDWSCFSCATTVLLFSLRAEIRHNQDECLCSLASKRVQYNKSTLTQRNQTEQNDCQALQIQQTSTLVTTHLPQNIADYLFSTLKCYQNRVSLEVKKCPSS